MTPQSGSLNPVQTVRAPGRHHREDGAGVVRGSVTAPVTAGAHFVAGPESPRRSGRLAGGSRSLRVELTDSKFRGFRLALWTPILS